MIGKERRSISLIETSEKLFGAWDSASAEVPLLNLDDSEEEIEVEGDGVAFWCYEVSEGYSCNRFTPVWIIQ